MPREPAPKAPNKKAARLLIADVGGRPLDVGDLGQTRHLEAMAIIVIRLLFSGCHPHSVFAFLSPDLHSATA
ncbi:hypothetical protein [Embleya sp. NPDC020886]|uniref:hypothetical protein n=1 Tax=Embleya sp. NPDC020886 TaxID=3363980 RepID=UPI0037B32425